jgi:hypothetical protein
MRHLLSRAGKKLAALGIVLAVLAAVIWWQRTPLLSWYYLRGLAAAEDVDRATWVECVAGLDAAVVPGLVDLLRQADTRACANAEAALAVLAKRWGPADPRTINLAQELTRAFGSLHQAGKEATLEWYMAALRVPESAASVPRPLRDTAETLLRLGGRSGEIGVRVRTLALAEVILARAAPAKGDLYRDLAVEGLTAKDAEVRARAIRLTMHDPLHADKALVDRVLPFLKDTAPEVRRAAVLAVGLAEESITVQEMLPLLQDPDAEVRRLCEAALSGRGLPDSHINLARKITDRRPGTRLEVVNLLQEADDLDPTVWLQHLSEDPSPAVRAAAIRFAAEDAAGADFRERVLQMSRDDPSPTVRQLASHYLNALQRVK